MNILAQHFHLIIHCHIEEVNEIDHIRFVPFERSITFKHFFQELGFGHFIKNIFHYRRSVLSLPEDGLYYVLYPYKEVSIFLAFFLRKRKLVIRVKSDPAVVLHSAPLMFGDGILKGIQRLLVNPIKSLFFSLISRIVFNGNLIFYTGNITVNRKNHLNQHEMISCPVLNRDGGLIKKDINHHICFVGGESNLKGLSVLLRALNESSLKDSITVNIIGIDKLTKQKNIKLASSLNVKLHGQVYDREIFYNLLSQNDILVMPSFAEKQGKVQLEAMSVGVVPICSDSGGTYMTIGNYYNGLLFKPGDDVKLRSHIEGLYMNEDFYASLKQNGLEYVKSLSLEKQTEYMATVINNFYNLS